MYKIRIVLDAEDDVIRTLLVDHHINLENLHQTITKSFNFEGFEMASFYKTDNEWNEGEEIPLFDMSESGAGNSMQNCFVSDLIPNVGDKLIYVYDFLKMWTFYVETIDVTSSTQEDLPKVILSVGEIPKEAPEKEFVAEKSETMFNDDFDNEFENLDDIDFDQY